MAVIRFRSGEVGEVRPGDVVFDTREQEPRYVLHVGIYVGEPQMLQPGVTLRVLGAPLRPRASELGHADWGAAGQYQPDEIGHRSEFDDAAGRSVRELAVRMVEEESLVTARRPRWKEFFRVDDSTLVAGKGRFVSGSCSQFVEYIYRCVGAPLVWWKETAQEKLPNGKWSLPPSLFLQAFWVGKYPFSGPWDERLTRWLPGDPPDLDHPVCLYGEREMPPSAPTETSTLEAQPAPDSATTS